MDQRLLYSLEFHALVEGGRSIEDEPVYRAVENGARARREAQDAAEAAPRVEWQLVHAADRRGRPGHPRPPRLGRGKWAEYLSGLRWRIVLRCRRSGSGDPGLRELRWCRGK